MLVGAQIVPLVGAPLRRHVEQSQHQLLKCRVEIDQTFEGRTIDFGEFIDVVFEIRRALVGRRQRIEVHLPPASVFGETHLVHRRFRVAPLCSAAALYRHGERQHAVGRGNEAAVAVGLLHIVVATLFDHRGAVEELGVIMNGPQIGRRKEVDHENRWRNRSRHRRGGAEKQPPPLSTGRSCGGRMGRN